jgi:SNF2 family DNA or RNA helicase
MNTGPHTVFPLLTQEQLKTHVDWTYMTDKTPLIYHYDGTRARDEEVVTLCQKDKTHAPLVFIDRAGTKPLPSADFLAMFRCVLTTTQRLTNEWKNGSYEEELKQDNGRKKYMTDFYEVGGSGSDSTSACSLLKVHWFRLIVDEGHSMGRGSRGSAILFASWIQAQRRWAMTGTPTPQTASSSGLNNLRGLMSFLQHDFFSPRLDGDKTWQGSIVRCWNSGSVSAFFRLHSLLTLLMVRHTKLDIDELPPPKFETTMLEMSRDEIASYNLLVSGIMSNLKITSMEGLTSGRQDSLLYPSQSRNAREGFTNVRLVCSGRHGLFPTIKDQAREELIVMLKALDLQGVKLKLVENFLHRVVTEQLSSCNVCGMQLHTLLLIPCGHMVCVDCFDNKVASCAVCEESFDVDTFQLLQPGIELKWHSPEEIDKKKAAEAPAEGSDAREGDSDELQVIDIANRVALQPASTRRRTRRPRDGHVCEYDVASSSGLCTLCLEEHFDCVLFNKSRCEVCYKRSKACPDYESKSFYLSNKLQELRSKDSVSLASSPMVEKRPLKAIVFSEFRSTLNLVGDRLIRQFGGGCVAEYWGKGRDDELVKFAKSKDCFCMLLGRTGSEGLDLSFVTHIFMLEKTWDKSLENQTISRAWRMGAKGHVEVETLIARDSAEETMAGMEATQSTSSPSTSLAAASASDMSWQDNDSISTKEYQRAKLLFLLKNLKLIRSQSQSDGQHTAASKKRRRAATSVDLNASTSNASEEPQKKAARVRFQA